MEAHRLVWDARNVDHIAEHQATSSEVKEVIFEDAPHYRRGPDEALYHVYGQTEARRYLFVVLRILLQRWGRVVTARAMTAKEKRLYQRVQKR